jgi:hypothetical protein
MNITIDVKSKMIEIEGNITVEKLNQFMQDHNFDPKQWSIRSKVVQFSNPVDTPIIPSTPVNPYWRDNIIYCSPGLEVNGTEVTVKY